MPGLTDQPNDPVALSARVRASLRRADVVMAGTITLVTSVGSETEVMTRRATRRLDPSWDAYGNTILEFPRSIHLRVDLRDALRAPTLARLRALGLGTAFAVVTPCNGRGIRKPVAANTMRVRALREDLKRRGCRFVAVAGVSPDRRHREPGFGVELTLDKAVALARAWEQSALFWFDGKRFWLVPALAPGDAVPLPAALRASRPRS